MARVDQMHAPEQFARSGRVRKYSRVSASNVSRAAEECTDALPPNFLDR
jgi:hypothetical protein